MERVNNEKKVLWLEKKISIFMPDLNKAVTHFVLIIILTYEVNKII